MRTLRQPGPAHPRRIDSVRGEARMLRYPLLAGRSLNQALTAPLVAAGFHSATVTFGHLALQPFHYVVPAVADDASHVAYFSATRAPPGVSHIQHANASFGWAQGAPFVHCHAVWREADGRRRGGHILPLETILAGDSEAIAWGFSDIRVTVEADIETNFSLFQPLGNDMGTGRGVLARVKPNEDIITATETVAHRHGIADAVVRGSLGSLIGTRFTDGRRVGGDATEVLVRAGSVRGGRASLDMLVVDMAGEVHEGWLERGENPVCITFDLVLEAMS